MLMGGLFLSSILDKVDGRGEAVGAEVATGMRKAEREAETARATGSAKAMKGTG